MSYTRLNVLILLATLYDSGIASNGSYSSSNTIKGALVLVLNTLDSSKGMWSIMCSLIFYLTKGIYALQGRKSFSFYSSDLSIANLSASFSNLTDISHKYFTNFNALMYALRPNNRFTCVLIFIHRFQ